MNTCATCANWTPHYRPNCSGAACKLAFIPGSYCDEKGNVMDYKYERMGVRDVRGGQMNDSRKLDMVVWTERNFGCIHHRDIE